MEGGPRASRAVHPAILDIRRHGRPAKAAPFKCSPALALCCSDNCSSKPDDVWTVRLMPTASCTDAPVVTDDKGSDDSCFSEPCVQEETHAVECCSLEGCDGAKKRNRRLRVFTNVPDKADPRDHLAHFPATASSLPPEVDLRTKQKLEMPNTRGVSSCVASAVGAAFHFNSIKRKLEKWPDFSPSILFINYNLRFLETPSLNTTGTSIRDGIKSAVTWGVCPDALWPHAASKLNEKPSPACYEAAKRFRATTYQSLRQTLPQLKGCIASGQPFVFGFIVHASFNSLVVERTGEMPMPGREDDLVEGGLAVCAVGYSDARQAFIVRNSSGSTWGDGGYFYMPYAYITDPRLSYDFWAITWMGKAPWQARVPGCAPM